MKFLAFLYSVILVLTGCSDKATDVPAMFELSEDVLIQNFEQQSGSKTIPIKTNLKLEDWSVKVDQGGEWCKANKETAALELVVEANTASGVRETKVYISSQVAKYEIAVAQLGNTPSIRLNKHLLKTTSDGGEVALRVTSNVDYGKAILPDWISQIPKTKSEISEFIFQVQSNPTYVARQGFIVFRSLDGQVADSCRVNQDARSGDVGDVDAPQDILIMPSGGKANQSQPGQGIENTFDGKLGSQGDPYHSPWNDGTKFPVILEYFFDDMPDMDYVLYHSRSGNGNFGKLKIYVSTQSQPDYVQQGEYDFGEKSASSKVGFGEGLKQVTKVKFEILSGSGGYVSCSEMQFFKKNSEATLHNKLLEVFTDLSCSEIRSEATQEKIDALPGYFTRVAMALKNGEYDEWTKDFRIRDYEPYSNESEWASKLMTKHYSNLDNPTGITAKQGETIIVLVGKTYGKDVAIQLIPGVASSGETFFLTEGVNKITVSQDGMLFIMYSSSPQDKPIRIHIPVGSGTVNGFFDLKQHKTDAKYAELLKKATYKYFCVRGEKIMFYFHLEKMREVVQNEILSAIHLWDNIVGWQQELMGIEDVRPTQVNNHIFAISPEDGYMWASDYQIGFVYTYLDNILLYDKVMAQQDNAWGPAHEIGHIHQKAINWPSSTESSNNLFSNYVIYKLGKYCSRGSELVALAQSRCIDKDPWCLMGGSTHQNEDTELHMRMNWQLWNYYHRCGFKPDFWQTLFKLLRSDRLVESDPGASQLRFAVNACKAAGEDLTEFFEMWGFFVPVNNITYEQYGVWTYNVTEEQIKEAKAEMAKYPKKAVPFYYLEDRKSNDVGIGNYKVGNVGYYTQFKDKVKITKNIRATCVGRTYSITDGDEAVAFELRNGSADGNLLYFSNFFKFEVPGDFSLDHAVLYAVQSDGTRKAVQMN